MHRVAACFCSHWERVRNSGVPRTVRGRDKEQGNTWAEPSTRTRGETGGGVVARSIHEVTRLLAWRRRNRRDEARVQAPSDTVSGQGKKNRHGERRYADETARCNDIEWRSPRNESERAPQGRAGREKERKRQRDALDGASMRANETFVYTLLCRVHGLPSDSPAGYTQ